MLHSTKLLNKILITLMALLLLFNTNYGAFKTSEAHANTWAAQFAEEAMASYYAGVVTSVMAVGAGATNANEFVQEHASEIYETAKATWPTMSADMQNNFKSSLSQMGDGIVTVGDWITGALDSLKGVFTTGSVEENLLKKDGIAISFNDQIGGGVMAHISALKIDSKYWYLFGYSNFAFDVYSYKMVVV